MCPLAYRRSRESERSGDEANALRLSGYSDYFHDLSIARVQNIQIMRALGGDIDCAPGRIDRDAARVRHPAFPDDLAGPGGDSDNKAVLRVGREYRAAFVNRNVIGVAAECRSP